MNEQSLVERLNKDPKMGYCLTAEVKAALLLIVEITKVAECERVGAFGKLRTALARLYAGSSGETE